MALDAVVGGRARLAATLACAGALVVACGHRAGGDGAVDDALARTRTEGGASEGREGAGQGERVEAGQAVSDRVFRPVRGWVDASLSLRVLPPTPLETEVRQLLQGRSVLQAHARAVREVEARQAEHGAESPEVGQALALLAEVQLAAGEPSHALETQLRAVRILTDAFGEDDPRVFQAAFSAARLSEVADRAGDALATYERLQRPVADAFGSESVHGAAVLAASGTLRGRYGQIAVAVDRLSRAEAIASEALPSSAEALAALRLELAGAAQRLGRPEQALEVLERLLQMPLLQAGGATVLVRARMLLATVHGQRGERDRAAQAAAEAVAAAEELDRRSGGALRLLVAEARIAEAESRLGGPATLDALAAMEREVGLAAGAAPARMETLGMRRRLGVALAGSGFYLRSRRHMRELMRTSEGIYGPGSQAMLPLELDGVRSALALGETVEARRAMASILPRLEAAVSSLRPDYVAALDLAARIAVSFSETEAAVRHWDAALRELRRAAPGAQQIAVMLGNRAVILSLADEGRGRAAWAELDAFSADRSDHASTLAFVRAFQATLLAERQRDAEAVEAARAAIDAAGRAGDVGAHVKREAALTWARAAGRSGRVDEVRRALEVAAAGCGESLPAELAPCAPAEALEARYLSDRPAAATAAVYAELSGRLPAEHPSVAFAALAAADALRATARRREADALLGRWAMLVGETMGADHPIQVPALRRRAEMLHEDGRTEEARAIVDRALRISGEHMSPTSAEHRRLMELSASLDGR